jgi:5-methylcytosine-specific restriction protein A
MPIAPKRPCPAPGCRALVDRGYCDQHRRDQHRAYHQASPKHKENNRFYASAQWIRVRDAHRALEPLCRECRSVGKLTQVEIVDHIIPREDGGAPFDHANLQSLCRTHHNAKTRRDEVKRGARADRVESAEPGAGQIFMYY